MRFEAKHHVIKNALKFFNYRNVQKNISAHHAIHVAWMSVISLDVLADNESGMECLCANRRGNENNLLTNLRSITSRGYKYFPGSILLTTRNGPVSFSKIMSFYKCRIHSTIVFDLLELHTLDFDENINSFLLSPTNTQRRLHCTHLPDFEPLSSYPFDNHKETLAVPLKRVIV